MKINVIVLSLLSSMVGTGLFAQDVEHDDMYFNATHRAKLFARKNAEEAVTLASTKKAKKLDEKDNNPTDSYSARNINPEFTSRAKSKVAQEDEENYFVNNYRYNTRDNYNNWNSGFNNWYGSSWYRSSFWAPSINSWNSPYYGYYDSWNSPWNDPYWSYNGWSSSYSYYSGNTWNYGWGGNYNYWNRPYCPGSSYYGYASNYGYRSNWYWNNYRPNVVAINNNTGNDGRGIVYGKRTSRSSQFTHNDGSNRSQNEYVDTNRGRTNAGGRVSNNAYSGRQRTEYYNSSWKTNNETESNTSTPGRTYSNPSRSTYTPSSYDNSNNSGNSTRSSWESNTRQSSPSNSTYTPSQSRSSSSSGGSSSGGSSSGGSRSSRSRDN